MDRMGRCARLAWEHGVECYRASAVSRPGVTTGHLLLGVLKERSCAGGLILAQMGLNLELAYGTTEFVLLHGRRRNGTDASIEWAGVPHTPAAKQVLDYSLEEANLFSATYPIGTEHILLGALRVAGSSGRRILNNFGIEVDAARAARDALWELLVDPE